jgi:hypothetical protein
MVTPNDLELYKLDRMTREEIIAAIQTRRDHLPADLLEGLEEQSTLRLQLRVVAARVIEILRIG